MATRTVDRVTELIVTILMLRICKNNCRRKRRYAFCFQTSEGYAICSHDFKRSSLQHSCFAKPYISQTKVVGFNIADPKKDKDLEHIAMSRMVFQVRVLKAVRMLFLN